MKKLLTINLLAFIFSGCTGHKAASDEVNAKPRSIVDVTTIRYDTIVDDLELSGNTVYLRRDVITAPLPAFIARVNCYLGKRVATGDLLYELVTKERKALGKDAQLIDSSLRDFGIVRLKAPATGIIATFDKQQKDEYVLEGAQLCTVAEAGTLAIQVNVPYDFVAYTPSGKNIIIILPDSSSHNAIITTPLPAMNTPAQTQSIVAKPTESLFLPENLIVKVLIRKGATTSRQILPKPCIQSDEMMKNFWIMKLINDSTAVKIKVAVGNSNDKDIEILSPRLSPSDQIVLTGAYGLPDTALVTISK